MTKQETQTFQVREWIHLMPDGAHSKKYISRQILYLRQRLANATAIAPLLRWRILRINDRIFAFGQYDTECSADEWNDTIERLATHLEPDPEPDPDQILRHDNEIPIELVLTDIASSGWGDCEYDEWPASVYVDCPDEIRPIGSA